MRGTMKISRLLACIAAALVITITACSRDPKPGTPEAAAVGDRYMHSMSTPSPMRKRLPSTPMSSSKS